MNKRFGYQFKGILCFVLMTAGTMSTVHEVHEFSCFGILLEDKNRFTKVRHLFTDGKEHPPTPLQMETASLDMDFG